MDRITILLKYLPVVWKIEVTCQITWLNSWNVIQKLKYHKQLSVLAWKCD